MIKGIVVFTLLFIPYLFLCIRAIKDVRKTLILSKKQKYFHIVAIIMIPYIWAVITREMLKRTKGSFEMPIKKEMEFKDQNKPYYSDSKFDRFGDFY